MCSEGSVWRYASFSSWDQPSKDRSSGMNSSGFGSAVYKVVDGLCRNCCSDPAGLGVDVDGVKDRDGNGCEEAEKTSAGGRQWTVCQRGSDGKGLFMFLLGFGVIDTRCFFSTGCLRVKNGCTCIGLRGDCTAEELSILMISSSPFGACMSSIGGNGNGPGIADTTGELSSMMMISAKRDERVILP